MVKKVALTGFTGHFGQHLAPLLKQRGHLLRVLLRGEMPGYWPLEEQPELVFGDLRDGKSLDMLVEGMDVVVHAGASISIGSGKAAELFEINTASTKLLYEKSLQAGVKRLVHLSSVHAYEPRPRHALLDEQRPLNFKGGRYDRSKAAAHQFLREKAMDGAMEVVILSPSSMLGPPDPRPSLLGHALLEMLHGRVPALFPGGFDFCDVRDVAQATLSALETSGSSGEYLLSGVWYSMQELAERLLNLAEQKKRPKALPYWVGYAGLPLAQLGARVQGKAPVYSKETLDILRHSPRNISSAKAQEAFGYRSRPLEESLGDLVEWWKLQGIWKP